MQRAGALEDADGGPIAVSSCTTGVESGSDGSTVLRLTMIGSPSTPSRAASVSRRASRPTQRLLVFT